VLRCIPGREHGELKRTTDAKSSSSARSGSVAFAKMPMARIAQAIGTFAFGKAMLDETGLDGEWDIKLEWTPGDKASLVKALEACGLQHASEPRRVRKLEVAAK